MNKLSMITLLFAAVTSFVATTANATSDVCSEGVSIPPFLSAGASPNLLMLLDNSGSMLDMAYTDGGDPSDATDNGTTCFDDTYLQDDDGTFNADTDYGGYFEKSTWYQWSEDSDPATAGDQLWPRWTASTSYAENAIVFDNGVFYRAYCGTPGVTPCTSSAVDNISEDTGVTWFSVGGADTWKNEQMYPDPDTGLSFVRYEDQLYYTAGGGTSHSASTSPSPLNDTGITDWVAVDHTWLPSTAYLSGDIVTYKGMIYKALGNFTTSTTGLFDDRDGSDLLRWQRMDEGYWKEVSGTSPCTVGADTPSYSHTYTDSSNNSVTDLEITMLDSSGNKITDVTTQTSDSVSCFAARGNFLNWATSSKFDIQKKILTGGKYQAGYEKKDANGNIDNSVTSDNDDDRLISESRGCAGSSYVKQITLYEPGTPLISTDDIKLTLRVRGSGDDDWVDTTDNTTRLDILAVKAGGFNVSPCQDAIDKMINVGSGFQSEVSACLSGPLDSQRPALNHALQYCWFTQDRNLTTIINDCETAYATTLPYAITAFDDAYNCTGIFDANLVHDARDGYIGRCFQKSSLMGSTCDPYTQVQAECDWTVSGNDPCTWWDGGTLLSNSSTQNYTRYCTQLSNDGTFCQNATKWATYYADSLSGLQCNPSDPVYASPLSGWSDILYPANTPNNDPADDPDYDPVDDAGKDGFDWCIYEAMEDFCGNIEQPEVIDPSDKPNTTSDYWNIPALLIDSGVLVQLGTARPLAVYKGFIKYELPVIQDSSGTEGDITERPDGPRGVIYKVAGDLRLGAMAFNNNGSLAECPSTNPSIAKYCPDDNKDGGSIIALNDLGMTMNTNGTPDDRSDDYEVWSHYNQLVAAINDIRATSWTPLAEAMFNAIGYYTQRSDMRLAEDDFMTDVEAAADANYKGAWADGTAYITGDIVSEGGKYYIAADSGTSNGPIPNDPNNYTSIDYDYGVHWTPIDPGQYSCQSNHILVITEGQSTADTNTTVSGFLTNTTTVPESRRDGTSGDDGDSTCAALDGSTYLDDLAYFAQFTREVENNETALENAAKALYGDSNYTLDGEIRQDITTHVVVAGALGATDGDECTAATIMTDTAVNGGTGTPYPGENPSTLEASLLAVFSDIMSRASAGSAASVISSSRSGDGAVYQAIFWPELTDDATQNSIKWAGEVHALFLDEKGLLYEDSDKNGKMDTTSDERLLFYYNDHTGINRTQACLDPTYYLANGSCPGDTHDACNPATDKCRELDDINYIWSAKDRLAAVASALIQSNRTTYLSATEQRYLFTWEDLNNDGKVDAGEQIPFTTSDLVPAIPLPVSSDRGSVVNDFVSDSEAGNFVGGGTPSASDAAKAVISWVRGEDQLNDETTDTNLNTWLDKKLRSRQFPFDTASGTEVKEWRLGDVIHSTPTVVSKPAEAYHYIYKDISYAIFAKRWDKRRQVVYFGANDGMMHAINGGFYHSGSKSFCRALNPNYNLTDSDTTNDDPCIDSGPQLGAELWGYIPYNLIPHLKCLANEEYDHKYYVDQRPRIFDVQIFADDCSYSTDINGNTVTDCSTATHPGGWGTIMVGSMRFGGTPINATDINGNIDDERQFTSSYFILDITNPEAPPTLLAEMTRHVGTWDANLGYSTPSPTMVVMQSVDALGDKSTKWYLILGNGPTTTKGENDQQGKIAVFPLNGIGGTTKTAFRFHDHVPYDSGPHPETGVFLIPDDSTVTGDETSYVSDLITVDFDVEVKGGIYRSDAVYFGTVDGEEFTGPDGATSWNGGGRLFRLVTKVLDGSNLETASLPSQWTGEWAADTNLTPTETPIRLMLNTHAPITAAPSVGWDGTSFWVYAGTGRFYDKKDKSDTQQQYFYALREPFNLGDLTNPNDDILSWDPIDWDVTSHSLLSSTYNVPAGYSTITPTPGKRGMLQTDNILVAEAASSIPLNTPYLTCADCDDISCTSMTDDLCFPSDLQKAAIGSVDYYLFSGLQNYIAGTSRATGLDGWYREFHEPRERNLGQAALLGGLLTYTSYQPYENVCAAEGTSALYAVHYQTGTAWYENVIGIFDHNGIHFVRDKLDLGRGMSTTASMHVGTGPDAATAFIQTSTGEIVKIGQENLPLSNIKSGRASWNDESANRTDH